MLREDYMTQLNSIISETGPAALGKFVKLCSEYIRCGEAEFTILCNSMLRAGRGVNPNNLPLAYSGEQDIWYESLKSGRPDFSLYSSDMALVDLWTCWLRYSRRYLLSIIKSDVLPDGRSLAADIGVPSTILDLGCGFGYTTACLKEIFPNAECMGTNLPDTSQFDIATAVGLARGFKVVADFREAPSAELIFASEYFEHFPDPTGHLTDILDTCRPRIILTANSFTAKAIGHFGVSGGDKMGFEPRTTSRRFGRILRDRGFEKVSTRLLWNSRPTYWKKKDT